MLGKDTTTVKLSYSYIWEATIPSNMFHIYDQTAAGYWTSALLSGDHRFRSRAMKVGNWDEVESLHVRVWLGIHRQSTTLLIQKDPEPMLSQTSESRSVVDISVIFFDYCILGYMLCLHPLVAGVGSSTPATTEWMDGCILYFIACLRAKLTTWGDKIRGGFTHFECGQ